MAQRLKRLPAMQETWVRSLGREDPLEKEMAPHSSTLAWKIPWTEEPGRLQSMGSRRVGHDCSHGWAEAHLLLPRGVCGWALFPPGSPGFLGGWRQSEGRGGTCHTAHASRVWMYMAVLILRCQPTLISHPHPSRVTSKAS